MKSKFVLVEKGDEFHNSLEEAKKTLLEHYPNSCENYEIFEVTAFYRCKKKVKWEKG